MKKKRRMYLNQIIEQIHNWKLKLEKEIKEIKKKKHQLKTK
jgi:hypothetical protein